MYVSYSPAQVKSWPFDVSLKIYVFDIFGHISFQNFWAAKRYIKRNDIEKYKFY